MRITSTITQNGTYVLVVICFGLYNCQTMNYTLFVSIAIYLFVAE